MNDGYMIKYMTDIFLGVDRYFRLYYASLRFVYMSRAKYKGPRIQRTHQHQGSPINIFWRTSLGIWQEVIGVMVRFCYLLLTPII